MRFSSLHGHVLALRTLRLILRLLDLMRPIEAQRLALAARLLVGLARRLVRTRAGRLEKHRHHRLVDALATHQLTVAAALLGAGARATILIDPLTTVPAVAQVHLAPAMAAQDQPLQQCRPLAGRAARFAAIAVAHQGVLLHPPLIREELLEGDIRWVVVANQYRPLATLDAAHLNRSGIVPAEAADRLALAERVGPRIDGVVQGAQHHPIARRQPDYRVRAQLDAPHRVLEPLTLPPQKNLARAAERGEFLEYRADRVGHRLVAAHGQLSRFVDLVTWRWDGDQLPALGLVPARVDHARDRARKRKLACLCPRIPNTIRSQESAGS
jgi:hypothetical protein